MEFAHESLDGHLMLLYPALLQEGAMNEGSRGETVELLGVVLRLYKPRARLSRSEARGKPFSALGELLWYLSGSAKLEFIEPYVPLYKKEAEDGLIHGAYGPRLFNMRDSVDQIANVISLLEANRGSRRAVIQLFNAEDIQVRYKDIPCTTTMQFFIRDDELHLAVTMRSNDACRGLPHDVFCFTMIQELLASRLNVGLGEYIHFAGSMHMYESDRALIETYIKEGWQRTEEMPPMPLGDQFGHLGLLLELEKRVRRGEFIDPSEATPSPYWADLLRLLQVFWAKSDVAQITHLMERMNSNVYRSYLEARRDRSN